MNDLSALLRILRAWPGARSLPPRPRELTVRDELREWLIGRGLEVIRERPTNGGRVDLFVPIEGGGVALELKVKRVAFARLLEQISRYAAADDVLAIVVLTWNAPQIPAGLQACGKPVVCHDYAGALFS